MINLIRMDLYRMRKGKAFLVCLIIAAVFALAMTPFEWLLVTLGRMLSSEVPPFAGDPVQLSGFISNPLPFLNAMLVMLSACVFFHADVENGYVKNIAGQMPQKGFTILSKFIAVIPHNLLFMLVGVAASLLGTLPFRPIRADDGIMGAIAVFLIKGLLLQSICAILLTVTASLRSKSLGSVLAVLLGTGVMSVVYFGLSSAVSSLLNLNDFDLNRYMPDQLLSGVTADTWLRGVLSALITAGIFLPLAIRIFDKRDVK